MDKPKFGGKGTKKQACVEKVCAAMTTSAAAKGRQQQKSSKAVADSVEGSVDPIVSKSVKDRDSVMNVIYTFPTDDR